LADIKGDNLTLRKIISASRRKSKKKKLCEFPRRVKIEELSDSNYDVGMLKDLSVGL